MSGGATPTYWDLENLMLGREGLAVNTVLDTKSLWSYCFGVFHEVSIYYSSGFLLRGRTPVDLNTDFEQQVFFF